MSVVFRPTINNVIANEPFTGTSASIAGPPYVEWYINCPLMVDCTLYSAVVVRDVTAQPYEGTV